LNPKGVTIGEIDEGLKVLVGPEVQDLSASMLSRLKQYEGKSTGSGVMDPWIKTVGSTCGRMASIAR